MDMYLIQGKTLAAIGDKIRNKLSLEKYSFKDDIGADGAFNSGAVTVYYKEYVDYNEGYTGLDSNVSADDVFIAYDFIADNNGVITPVIYKTDISGDEPDTPDYQDQHFYVGRVEIDGTQYDKWRKIEPDSEMFDWDSVGKKFIYTNVIIEANTIAPTDMPSKVDEVYNAGLANAGGSDDSVIGTWKFNATLNVPDMVVYCNFKTTREGMVYNCNRIDCSSSWGGNISFDGDDGSLDEVYCEGSWGYEECRTIVILEDPADAVFITWLRANAKLLSYDDGYSAGYNDGLDKGYNNCISDNAPLIIQGRTAPTIATNYTLADGSWVNWGSAGTQLMYPINLFDNATVETVVYDWENDVSYEVMVESQELVMSFENKSPFYVNVFMKTGTDCTGSSMSYLYLMVQMPPLSYIEDVRYNPANAGIIKTDVTIVGLRFSTDGN